MKAVSNIYHLKTIATLGSWHSGIYAMIRGMIPWCIAWIVNWILFQGLFHFQINTIPIDITTTRIVIAHKRVLLTLLISSILLALSSVCDMLLLIVSILLRMRMFAAFVIDWHSFVMNGWFSISFADGRLLGSLKGIKNNNDIAAAVKTK